MLLFKLASQVFVSFPHLLGLPSVFKSLRKSAQLLENVHLTNLSQASSLKVIPVAVEARDVLDVRSVF